jgi:hypothetical protein
MINVGQSVYKMEIYLQFKQKTNTSIRKMKSIKNLWILVEASRMLQMP